MYYGGNGAQQTTLAAVAEFSRRRSAHSARTAVFVVQTASETGTHGVRFHPTGRRPMAWTFARSDHHRRNAGKRGAGLTNHGTVARRPNSSGVDCLDRRAFDGGLCDLRNRQCRDVDVWGPEIPILDGSAAKISSPDFHQAGLVKAISMRPPMNLMVERIRISVTGGG